MSSQSEQDDAYVYQEPVVYHTLISAFLVFFLQCGFNMLQVGQIRQSNGFKQVVRNLIGLCWAALGWYAVGYAFSVGDGNFFIGWKRFFLINAEDSEYGVFFYQFGLAIVAATVAYGALVERLRFSGHVLSFVFIVMVLYPIVVHWVWHDQGWLSYTRKDDRLFGSGMFDFAGSGVIHTTGGFAGLAGAIVLGARLSRFDEDGRIVSIAGHYPIITILGMFVLWFGWYGFIAAGPMTSTIGGVAAVAITLSAATSCVVTGFITTIIELFLTHKFSWDVVQCAYGALAGLVSISAGCAVVDAWAAVAIGAIGACVYLVFSRIILHFMYIDDPLDVGAVHGFCGYWGVLAAGLFADKEKMLRLEGPTYGTYYGAIKGGGVTLIRANAVGGVAIMGWSFFIMLVVFIFFRLIRLLRIPTEIEETLIDEPNTKGPVYFLSDRNEKVKEIKLQHQLSDIQKDIEDLKDMKKQLLSTHKQQQKGLKDAASHEE